MTPEALRYRCNDLGLTHGGLARLLDVRPRVVRRWMSGATPIPAGVEGDLDSATPEDIELAMGGSR